MLFRHCLGRLNFGVFYQVDDGGGGGGGAEPAEPSYEIPSEVARSDSQPGGPPAADAAPAGEAPPADEPPVEQIPKYRLDEAIAQRDYLQGMIQHQQAQIAALMQRMPMQPPAAQPERPQLSEQDIKIRDRLYAVIPELALLGQLRELVENREAIMGAAQAVPAWQSAETQYWDRYAENSHQSIGDAAAAYLLGQGKTTKDLNEHTRTGLRSSFIRWVTSDPTRAMRYEREDPSLPKEFWGAYRAAVYDPLRRDGQATLLNQQPPRLPQGGGGSPAASGTPPAARPPAAPADDDDAIHARAWAMRDTVTPR